MNRADLDLESISTRSSWTSSRSSTFDYDDGDTTNEQVSSITMVKLRSIGDYAEH
ncbi:hypothetical protein PanWU01x14_010040, partial [Parasponia andersonii]